MSNEDYTDISFNNIKERPASGNSGDSPIIKEGERSKQTRFSAKKKQLSSMDNKKKAERRESAKVRQFIRILDEVSPIFSEIKSRTSGNSEEFQSELLKAFKNQKEIIESLSIAWGLSSSIMEQRIVISHISKNISNIISQGKEFNFTKDDILSMGYSISDIHKDKAVFGELLEDELISSDLLVNIKAAMIEPSIKLGKLLDDLLVNDDEKRKIYKEFHRITYDLSKDIAFNWDKEAVIEDRESLFVSVINSCSDVVFTTLKKSISSIMKNEPIVLETSLVWSWMSSLNKEILNNDMGYLSHPEMDIYWLKNQLATLIISRVQDIECLYFSASEKNIIHSYYLSIFEQDMVLSWKEESEKKLSEINKKVENTPEEEMEKLLKSEEFLAPMEIRSLFKNFYKRTEKRISLFDLGLNFEELKRESSRNFAIFWGLSNAICKLRI